MTNTSISHGRLAQLVAAGEELIGATVPVLLIQPRSKKPIPSPSGFWWTITDPDDVESAIKEALAHHHDLNLALLAGRNKGSPVLVVDVDGPSGVDQGKRLGLHRGLDCWIQRTGRGGVRCQFVFYQEPDLELKRTIKADDLPLDLITNGYCLVPPSRTVGQYRWFPGHSPADIPVTELCAPPSQLVDWWLHLRDAPTSRGDLGPSKQVPLGKAALYFVAHGAPHGKQRMEAVAAARNYLSAGCTVEDTASALWRGFQQCDQDPADPWTFEDALAIAKDLAQRPAPALEERKKRGPVFVRFREEANDV